MTEWAAADRRSSVGRIFETALPLTIVALLLVWAFRILSPFVDVVVWSAIIAVAAYPLFRRLRSFLGGRDRLAAVVFVTLAVAILAVPAAGLALRSVSGARELAKQWEAGQVRVPAPTERVKDWPLVGERVYSLWRGASENLEATLRQFQEPVREMGSWALHRIAGIGLGLLMFTFSLIIAGALMAQADACQRAALALGKRLAGEAGDGFVGLVTTTVRSVARGVLGTAFVQALLAALGLVLMGIPLAGLWALVALILGIVQLPQILVLGPIAVWALSAREPAAATIFAVYCLLVSASDSFLKPLLLGRGADVPMLVILLGAIGGMLGSGILGLFTGSVVLALVYRLFVAWLQRVADRPAPGS